MNDKYIDKIEKVMEERRNKNPLNQEMNRLFNEMFPTKQFYSIFKLGYASALTMLKNDLYQFLCKDCQEYIDIIIKSNKEDEEMLTMLNKLLK